MGRAITLELYYYEECPYCQVVLRALRELGPKAAERVQLKNTRSDAQAAEYLLKNTGRRTVPCLFIDGVPMHESADIAKWLKQNLIKS